MPSVSFLGENFEMAERIGLMPLMRFAKVAKTGVDSQSLDGLASMFDLLEQCIAEKDWQRFQDHADAQRADGEELMAIVGEVLQALTARPTRRPSASSPGPTTTEPRSTAASSSPVIARLEQQGRPDLALMVTQADEVRATA